MSRERLQAVHKLFGLVPEHTVPVVHVVFVEIADGLERIGDVRAGDNIEDVVAHHIVHAAVAPHVVVPVPADLPDHIGEHQLQREVVHLALFASGQVS